MTANLLYKSERIKRGLSQAALAELVGVSRGCINYRESGHDRYPITTEAWLAICSLPQATKRKSRKGQNAKLSHEEGEIEP
jgi:DNA-binding XRE family transcriptional regulator